MHTDTILKSLLNILFSGFKLCLAWVYFLFEKILPSATGFKLRSWALFHFNLVSRLVDHKFAFLKFVSVFAFCFLYCCLFNQMKFNEKFCFQETFPTNFNNESMIIFPFVPRSSSLLLFLVFTHFRARFDNKSLSNSSSVPKRYLPLGLLLSVRSN